MYIHLLFDAFLGCLHLNPWPSCSGTLIVLQKLFRPHLCLAQRKLEAFTISAAGYSVKNLCHGPTRKAAVKSQAISSGLSADSQGASVGSLQLNFMSCFGSTGCRACRDGAVASQSAWTCTVPMPSLWKSRHHFAEVQGAWVPMPPRHHDDHLPCVPCDTSHWCFCRAFPLQTCVLWWF